MLSGHKPRVAPSIHPSVHPSVHPYLPLNRTAGTFLLRQWALPLLHGDCACLPNTSHNPQLLVGMVL